jgi:hypothetical protein
MTRYTAFAFDEPVDYEVERACVFRGLEDRVAVDMRGMGAEEMAVQVGFLGSGSGGRGVVRVVMGVEIGGGGDGTVTATIAGCGGGMYGGVAAAAAVMAVLGKQEEGVDGKEGE